MSQPLILVTNDDGVNAPGLASLANALEAVGEVWVCAPSSEQSAVSHGISLRRPLRVEQVRERWFMADGTPTDCVMLAANNLLKRTPALVVSGINNGANLGDDVTYSGTVAGAHEGMLLGLPAIAVSNVEFFPEHFETSAYYATMLAQNVLDHGLPPDTMLNVNTPDVVLESVEGIELTRMGRGAYQVEIVERVDPRGETYYWIGGTKPSDAMKPGTDFEAVHHKKVSVTPLHRDLTNTDALASLADRVWDE